MRRLAFVFTSPPHTTSAGREGLDALLAASAFSEDVWVFFVGDGVFQLLPNQQPAQILARDYVATFGVMALYDIEHVYLCADSLRERGLEEVTEWAAACSALSAEQMRAELAHCDVILTF